MTYTHHADHHAYAAQDAVLAEIAAALRSIGAATRSLAALADRMASAVQFRLREREAVRALSELDDRTLKDIGVHRSEIRHIARRAALARGVSYRTVRR